MKLEWSVLALADRDGIFDYIEQDSARQAATVDSRIEAAALRLIRFPNSGRPGRVEGTRELVVLRTPFIIAYRTDANTVRILRVLHGARIWPDPQAKETE